MEKNYCIFEICCKKQTAKDNLCCRCKCYAAVAALRLFVSFLAALSAKGYAVAWGSCIFSLPEHMNVCTRRLLSNDQFKKYKRLRENTIKRTGELIKNEKAKKTERKSWTTLVNVFDWLWLLWSASTAFKPDKEHNEKVGKTNSN